MSIWKTGSKKRKPQLFNLTLNLSNPNRFIEFLWLHFSVFLSQDGAKKWPGISLLFWCQKKLLSFLNADAAAVANILWRCIIGLNICCIFFVKEINQNTDSLCLQSHDELRKKMAMWVVRIVLYCTYICYHLIVHHSAQHNDLWGVETGLFLYNFLAAFFQGPSSC